MEFDDGSEQDVIRKFLRASDSVSDGISIECKRRPGRQTAVNQDASIHVSNLDSAVQESELRAHLLKAGLRDTFKVSIARRADGRSNCHGWVTFEQPEKAQRLLDLFVAPLRGRELKLRWDNVSEAQLREPGTSASRNAVAGSGWVRCKGCHCKCSPLLEVLLLEGERLRKDSVPAGKFDSVPTFFCVGREASLSNCDVAPHPDAAEMSFKLALINCSKCHLDLGNVQKASRMQGNVQELLGERVVHFKCASVLLELPDRQDLLLEVRKWQFLAQATGRESIYRLAQLTLRQATDILGLTFNSKVPGRNTSRHARIIPRNPDSLPNDGT